MERMIKDLLVANFRHWGATQYRQYQTLMGHVRHIGVELEFHDKGYVVSAELRRKNPVFEKGFITRYDQSEIHRLFSVEDPKKMIKDISETIKCLREVRASGQSETFKFQFFGSMHVNVQVPGDFRLSTRVLPFTGMQSLELKETSIYGKSRLHSATGITSTLPEDWVAQFLLAASLHNSDPANNQRKVLDIIKDVYPKSLRDRSCLPLI